MSAPRVLIVEDETVVALSIKTKLSTLGYEVSGIEVTGEDAVAHVLERSPDVVLMDIRLEGDMDGVQAAEKIREISDVPVIYLTAYTDENTLARAKGTTPYGYIIKPMEDRELRTGIEMALSRHELEARERENRQWLEAIMKSIGEAIIAVDGDEKIKFMNPLAQRITGVSQDQALGRDLEEVYNPKRVGPEDSQTGKPGELCTDDYCRVVLRVENDREVPLEECCAPIKGARGEVTGRVIVFRDITERVKAEEAILKSELKYLNLFIHSSDGIILHDGFGPILDVNRRALELFGYGREEMIFKGVPGLFPDEAKQEPKDMFSFLEPDKQGSGEFICRKKTGDVFLGEFSSSLVDIGGRVAVQSIIRDVTEKKFSESALKESENRYRTIFETTGAATIIVREDLLIILANTEFEKISGYARHEIQGKMALTNFVHAQDEKCILEYCRQRFVDPATVPSKCEFQFQNRAGRVLDVLATVNEIPGTRETVYSLLDITERKRSKGS